MPNAECRMQIGISDGAGESRGEMMGDPKEFESESREPVRPQFLDYAGRLPENSSQSTTGVGVIVGFICSFVSDFVFIASMSRWNSPWIAVPVFGASLIVCTLLVGKLVGFRGFIPGIVIGFSLTCLVPLGIYEVFCSNLSKL
jgi:hypothetical protein